MPHPTPATVVALYRRVRAAVESPTVRVDLGPVGEFEEPDAIAIGLATSTPEVAPAQVAAAGLLGDRYAFDVVCSVQSTTGDDDPQVSLTRVGELSDAVRGQLPAVLADVAEVWSAQVERESFTWVDANGAVAAFAELVVRVTADRPA